MNKFILVALVVMLTGYSGTQADSVADALAMAAKYAKLLGTLTVKPGADSCKTSDCEKTSGNVCLRIGSISSGCVAKASCEELVKLASDDDVVYCGATNVAVNAVVMLVAAVGAMLYTRLQ